MAVSFDIEELTVLRELAHRYRSAGAALAEAAVLRAALQLPKETVHVVSDVHGEYKKLRHIINNASGRLRPLVASLGGGGALDEREQRELLSVLYYPRETMEHLRESLADAEFRRRWVRRTLRLQFEVVRQLARNYRRADVRALFPVEAREICEELLSEPSAGRALFDAFDSLVRRAFRKGAAKAGDDADGLWYLWTGARSPLFGKERMSTFEQYFVEDKSAHTERKNAYFSLTHDADFCRRVAAEFGVGPDGLLVNGHVPVRVEKGEEPVRRSGSAVTIDGSFSESYGDRGYTLILGPEGVSIAELHHFKSIAEAITSGADIVPRVVSVRAYERTRRVSDTEQGEAARQRIKALERLILAYKEGALLEAGV